jgi:hypothetical protein
VKKMIGKLIVFVIVLVAGVLTGTYLMGAPLLSFSDLQGHAQNLWLFLQEHWIKLAGAVGGVITGIGYLASKVIGKKNETINNLNEISTQKDHTINYLESQLKSDGAVAAFTEKYGEDAFTKIETLATELQTTKTTLNEKLLEIKDWETKQDVWDQQRHRLQEDTRVLKKKIEQLQHDLAVERGEIKLPVQ